MRDFDDWVESDPFKEETMVEMQDEILVLTLKYQKNYPGDRV